MPNDPLHIIVLMGGPSSEHDVSLASGANVVRALASTPHRITPVTITRDGQWLLPIGAEQIGDGRGAAVGRAIVSCGPGRAIDAHRDDLRADVVFLAMHGAFGEDGTIQGFLETAGIPYTGSGVTASALAMDKTRSGALFAAHGLRVPATRTIARSAWDAQRDDLARTIAADIGFPCVTKPSNGGSSVGVTIVQRPDQLDAGIAAALATADVAVVQSFVAGREVTCGVLEDADGRAIALPPTEIVPKSSTFFDYTAKYTTGGSEEITPARLTPELTARVQDTAVRAHDILGCSGMSRTDMIIAGDDLFVLETNTLPGMTAASLLPKAAAAAGIAFPDLLERIIRAGLRRRTSV